jgi:hypothetical protein
MENDMKLTEQTYDGIMLWPIEDVIETARLKGVEMKEAQGIVTVRATAEKLALIAKGIELWEQSAAAQEREQRRHDAAEKQISESLGRKMEELAAASRRRWN